MTHFSRNTAVAAVAATMMAGCGAKSANGRQATEALQETLRAQSVLSNRSIADFPIGTSVSTLFDDAGQMLIARKVGNSDASNCSRFDIMTHRPTSNGFLSDTFGHGDTSTKKAVKICVL